MLQLNIKKAVKFAFEDRNWFKKTGIFFGVLIITTVLSALASFAIGLSNGSIRLDNIVHDQVTSFQNRKILSYITGDSSSSNLASTGISLITLPFTFYMLGYSLKATKNVMNGEDPALPDHKDIKETLTLALAQLLGIISVSIVITPILLMIAFPLVAVWMLLKGSYIATIAIITFVIVFFLLITLVSGVILPAMTYSYLKSENLKDLFNFSVIWQTMKKEWVSFTVITLLITILSFPISMIVNVSKYLLIGYLLGPIVQVITMFISAHLRGQVYSKLKEKGI